MKSKGDSGFIYIWRDRKFNRYYIGSHWGPEDDGYICSSNSMRDAYRRRPKDFKRRILSIINTNRDYLLAEEQRWLDMIKIYEFGYKYYNINAKAATYLWWMNEETKRLVTEKISTSKKGTVSSWKGKTASNETREKQRQAKVGKPSPRKGKKLQWITNDTDDRLINMNEEIPVGWHKGRSLSPTQEQREHLSRLNTGKKFQGNQYVKGTELNGR